MYKDADAKGERTVFFPFVQIASAEQKGPVAVLVLMSGKSYDLNCGSDASAKAWCYSLLLHRPALPSESM